MIPSGDVITRVPPPEIETATNSPPPYASEPHDLETEEDRVVQVMPSEDVITWSAQPLQVPEVATNNPPPYVTACQPRVVGEGATPEVQLMPSVEYITAALRVLVP